MSFPGQPGDGQGRYPGWGDVPPGQPIQGPPPFGQQTPEPREPAPYSYQPPRQQGKGPWVWLIPLVVILLVAALVAVAWGLGLFGTRTGQAGADGAVTVTSTQELVTPAEGQAGGGGPSPEPVIDAAPAQRPAYPALPAGAVAANEAARSGLPAGDFNNVYRGTDVTSEPFALAVRNDFVGSYLANGNLNQVVYTVSPVTGQRYEMNCADNGSYVTCRGGNNAVVYIS